MPALVQMARQEGQGCWERPTNSSPVSCLFSFKLIGHAAGPTRDHNQANLLTIDAKFLGKSVSFLIDSGAEKSIISSSLVPSTLLFPTHISLSGVGGEMISTFGQLSCKIAFPQLRREYAVTLISANTRSILGADFITEHGLQLDMKKRCLIDPELQMSSTLTVSSHSSSSIQFAGVSTHSIFNDFPNLLKPPDYTDLPNSDVFHEINVTGPPVFSKPRPLSPSKLEAAKKEFDLLLKLKIVRPSCSPWASPLHMVPKADGSWRPCGDYRKVNSLTIPDRYPLPNLQTFHFQMAGAVVFSKLDLIKAYHFIPVKPADVEKTAISTPFGSFEYVRMPFGLRNSAGTFQRYIDTHFRDLPFTLTYIDDILIFSNSFTEHQAHLRKVLQRLDSIGLRVNQSKCEIAQERITFLGYSVSASGISPPEEKVEALQSLPAPANQKDLVRYMGMFTFYQRCIPGFAEMTLPLRDAIHSSEFSWGEPQEKSFQQLKSALAQSTQLTFPKPGCHLTVTADASSRAIGACLNQVEDGCSKPLCFFSRKLSDAERKFSTFDRELLAVFSAMKKWKPIVDGCRVTVFSDHKPLVGAFKNTRERLSDKQQRQLSFLSELVVDIVHIAGKDNVVADTLSRPVVNTLSMDKPIDLIAIAKSQALQPQEYSEFKGFDIGVPNLTLFCETSQPNPRPVVPFDLRFDVFRSLHFLCHPGIKATIRLINTRYFWPSLQRDVKSWCTECLDCQKSKVGRHTRKQIGSLPCPSQRFSHVHMDIVGPLDQDPLLPNYLLTVIDSHTRWLEVQPLKDISAKTVVKAFLFCWVSRFGPPLYLTTDRGTQFCSELMETVTEELGIHHIRTTAYNPRANGMVERVHRTLKGAIKARGGLWLEQLPIILLGLRTRPDDDGSSAFSRLTGEQPLLPPVVTSNIELTELAIQLQKLPFNYKMPRAKSITAFHPEKLRTCTHIWLRVDRVRKPLEAPYQGPFEVIQRHEDTITISIRGKPVTVSIDRVKPATLPPQKESPQENPPSSNAVDEEAESTEAPRTRSGRRVAFKKKEDYEYF